MTVKLETLALDSLAQVVGGQDAAAQAAGSQGLSTRDMYRIIKAHPSALKYGNPDDPSRVVLQTAAGSLWCTKVGERLGCGTDDPQTPTAAPQ
jgi:hypothetical protein